MKEIKKITKKDLLKKVGKDMISTYDIEKRFDGIIVYKPSFINIKFDERFAVEDDNEYTIQIRNSKVIVTLWKKSKIMHTTVL